MKQQELIPFHLVEGMNEQLDDKENQLELPKHFSILKEQINCDAFVWSEEYM